ncbi:MAG: SDR family oxidoreductase [Gammaproteobacteria bacterium]|nr:SDR family oxidoreductase [Gammaproteobacteria bacterium]
MVPSLALISRLRFRREPGLRRFSTGLQSQQSRRATGLQDVANAVAFLAGDVSQHINGVNLQVDGGFLKRVDY